MSSAQPVDLPPASRTAERAAAAARRAAFPFRFPRDERLIGGAYPVAENARRLLRFFYLARRLGGALGSWTLAIADFEVKVETGRHIFWHYDAAARLRQRLTEQEQRLAQIDAHRDADIDRLIDELLCARDVPEMLVGLHVVAGRALISAMRHHLETTCPVADAPTVRVLKQCLVDYEPMLAWARAAIAAYVAGGVDEAQLERWRVHGERVLAAIGGVTGGQDARPTMPALRGAERPYARGTIPMRDARFTTFTKTGDYDVNDGRRLEHGYAHERLHFLRSQRDEVDAIEAFGTFLWDIRLRDFDAEYHLARITWDETRHTEIGHRTLQMMGYDPFELPNRLTSSTCRGPMEAAFAMAEINLFGEVGVMKTIPGLIEQARAHDDLPVAHVLDYIRSDERTHVKKGQPILKAMTDLDMPALELRTRELFTECLIALGAMQPGEPGFVMSRDDIERLVGE